MKNTYKLRPKPFLLGLYIKYSPYLSKTQNENAQPQSRSNGTTNLFKQETK